MLRCIRYLPNVYDMTYSSAVQVCRIVLNLRRAAALEGVYSSSSRSPPKLGANSGATQLTPVTPRFAPTKIPQEAFDFVGIDMDMEKQESALTANHIDKVNIVRLQPAPKGKATSASVASDRT